jgi:hypothetical protein
VALIGVVPIVNLPVASSLGPGKRDFLTKKLQDCISLDPASAVPVVIPAANTHRDGMLGPSVNPNRATGPSAGKAMFPRNMGTYFASGFNGEKGAHGFVREFITLTKKPGWSQSRPTPHGAPEPRLEDSILRGH